MDRLLSVTVQFVGPGDPGEFPDFPTVSVLDPRGGVLVSFDRESRPGVEAPRREFWVRPGRGSFRLLSRVVGSRLRRGVGRMFPAYLGWEYFPDC